MPTTIFLNLNFGGPGPFSQLSNKLTLIQQIVSWKKKIAHKMGFSLFTNPFLSFLLSFT